MLPLPIGYHGDDGNIFSGFEDPTYITRKPFQSGDLIGVNLDFNTATLTFSRNKENVQTIPLQANQDYYPCVGISSPGGVVQLETPTRQQESSSRESKSLESTAM